MSIKGVVTLVSRGPWWPLPAGSGMGAPVLGDQLDGADLGVKRRRVQALVAKQSLDVGQLCAGFHQVHRERVAQGVRAELREPRLLASPPERAPNALLAHPAAVGVEEERVLFGARFEVVTDAEIAA